ncbi:hypothetical protein [uncultured Acidaminococcus sp.]|uniref:hypothetical protein n=1 Tax=uncultured Acidaminococcus sp. TaxID=352152 RepID=UPI002584B97A|nr:hypothetical protein [uncultured Acidaminococcus sp.]
MKEYLEKQTSENYVSKTDATVQDGAIVKAANTIGENVTNLDAALTKEKPKRSQWHCNAGYCLQQRSGKP